MAKKSEPLQSAEKKFSSSEYEFTSEQILAREKLERDFEETLRVGREEGRKKGLEEGRKKGLEEAREEAREEGRKEGWKEGWEESCREVVSNALKLDLSMDQIAAITGLPLEEASRLADSLKGYRRI
ncbi:MAG: hypothetical protein LBW85_06990 [Deltaproteobacteria bacterium]|jgi:flagellar biosynthesis/type III secretory pathway protein FliH|nr:hypothetical protein [Deltaproteobacteria bacterium]